MQGEYGNGKQRQCEDSQVQWTTTHQELLGKWRRLPLGYFDPLPRMQSPPKVLAPSAARDRTDMENRVIQQKDESLVIFSSQAVKPSFTEVLTHQEL